MSNYRDDDNITADVSPELGFCPECEDYFEFVKDEDGTYLDCDCPREDQESFRELDFS